MDSFGAWACQVCDAWGTRCEATFYHFHGASGFRRLQGVKMPWQAAGATLMLAHWLLTTRLLPVGWEVLEHAVGEAAVVGPVSGVRVRGGRLPGAVTSPLPAGQRHACNRRWVPRDVFGRGPSGCDRQQQLRAGWWRLVPRCSRPSCAAASCRSHLDQAGRAHQCRQHWSRCSSLSRWAGMGRPASR